MEQPFPGCEQDENHVDRCMFDVLVILDQLYTRQLRDDAVIEYMRTRGLEMHPCHITGAFRQLVAWAPDAGAEPGQATEHVLGWQVRMVERELQR